MSQWAGEFTGRNLLIGRQKGLKLSHGAAPWLRREGVSLKGGGFEAWRASGAPPLNTRLLPKRDDKGGRVPDGGVAPEGHHDAGLAGLVRRPRLAG